MYKDFSSGQKGNVGLAMAIAYFCRCGYTVALPLTDTQPYDLIVDIDGTLKKVQAKFTSKAYDVNNTNYSVDLRLRGHVNAKGQYYDKGFNKDAIDFLFIYTASNTQYLIPVEEVNSITMTLGAKYNKYIVN